MRKLSFLLIFSLIIGCVSKPQPGPQPQLKILTPKFASKVGMPPPMPTLIVTPGNQLNLIWNPSIDGTVDGYNVYMGTVGGTYTNFVSVGNVTNYTVFGIKKDVTYYLMVTATSPGGESLPSNEISYLIPTTQPPPSSRILQITGTEFDASNVAFWQLTPTNSFSSYTNNNSGSIVWNTASATWFMSLANSNVIYSTRNIINTNWTKIKGTNSFVKSVAVGTFTNSPPPTSVLMNSYIVCWGIPYYKVWVTGDLNQPWTLLTTTKDPYVFVSRLAAPPTQFFRIEAVFTNSITLSPQN